MKELTSEDFADEIGQGKAVVDFWAAWCGPCKVLGPNFEEASKEHDDVNFFKVNVDEEGAISQKYGVRSIPTLLFFEDGEVVHTAIGAMNKDKINSEIEAAFD